MTDSTKPIASPFSFTPYKEKEGEELVHAISTITRRTTLRTFAHHMLIQPPYAKINASQHVRTCAMPYPRVAA